MIEMSAFSILTAFIALVALMSTYFWNGRKNLPPGPWGLPILGHLAFLGSRPAKTLLNWKKKYGSIIYCRMGSFPTVFLCDAKLVKQAFNMAELAGRGEFDGLVPRGDRKGNVFIEGPRQIEQRNFALTTLKDFGFGRRLIEGLIQDSLVQFLYKIKTEGSDQRAIKSHHIADFYVISPLLKILLTDEPSAAEVEEVCSHIDRINDMGSIIHLLAVFIPEIETFTKWVTFGRVSLFRERSRNYKAVYRCMEVQIAKRNMSRVKGQPQKVVDVYLDAVDEATDERSVFHPSYNSVAHFIGDLVSAGVHTTAVTIEWMLLYAATCAGVQKKLQEEIDEVIGPCRRPALSDRPKMGYMDAAIYELLRLSSIGIFGLDHKALKDVVLQDYRIPKGTIIFANLWGIHHDPEVWGPDVEEFRPERWLGETGRKLKSSHMLAFSTGKRSCIGESLARDTLFIFITGILQHFTVTFEHGSAGPGLESSTSLLLTPKPFKVLFTSRHAV